MVHTPSGQCTPPRSLTSCLGDARDVDAEHEVRPARVLVHVGRKGGPVALHSRHIMTCHAGVHTSGKIPPHIMRVNAAVTHHVVTLPSYDVRYGRAEMHSTV